MIVENCHNYDDAKNNVFRSRLFHKTHFIRKRDSTENSQKFMSSQGFYPPSPNSDTPRK